MNVQSKKEKNSCLSIEDHGSMANDDLMEVDEEEESRYIGWDEDELEEGEVKEGKQMQLDNLPLTNPFPHLEQFDSGTESSMMSETRVSELRLQYQYDPVCLENLPIHDR